MMKNLLTPAVGASLRNDLFAGIVVFLVALPLCLGIASASGVDPLAGLLAGVVGGTVVALLSGSRLSVSGPAAGLVVIVVEATELSGGFSALLTAVMLAGALQLLFGLLRIGKLAAYIPSSVVNGMLAAIGLLLIMQQAPVALGMTASSMGLPGNLEAEQGSTFGPSLVALVSLVVLFGWSSKAMQRYRLVRALPAPLVVVAWGIVYSLATTAWLPALAIAPSAHIVLPALDSFDSLGQALSFPAWAAIGDPEVWELGMTIAIIASLETLLSLAAVNRLDPRRETAPPNRELGAQGVGNLLAGLIGALPITSVIVRSSANVNAGAATRLSAIIHGILLLLSLFLLVDVLNFVPLACLAAILLHTGYKLASPRLFASAWQTGYAHWVPFGVTIAGVLATDLLIGIALGVAASAVIVLQLHRQAAVSLTEHDGHYLLRFHKDLSFLIKVRLSRYLAEVPPGGVLIIDGSAAHYIDPDIQRLLADYIEEAATRRIVVELRHVPLRTGISTAAAH
jgi:MFS superfamily sulfate permease-like transporter